MSDYTDCIAADRAVIGYRWEYPQQASTERSNQ